MKKIEFKLLFLILVLFYSCESKDNTNEATKFPNVTNEALNYLSDKAITSVEVNKNCLWILSSKHCDTCYISPAASYIPLISQLTMINDSFLFEEPTAVSMLVIDNHGNLFTSFKNKIYKVKGIKDYDLFLETGDFSFNYFVFDKDDNIWLGGENGIAYWNGNTLKIYNTGNSDLPSNITHGLVVDNKGVIWVTLDFKGILKIENNNWKIISNSEIPGLSEYSYLYSPVTDINNNVWFNVFSTDTTSSILKFNGNDWKYEYPNQIGYGNVCVDSEGIIWVIYNEYKNDVFNQSTLTYLQNNIWIKLNVDTLKTRIFSVNSDKKNIYIGTLNGLKVIRK